MVDESELEGFKPDRYFARSWALLARDKGWIKPVLVLAAAQLVPVLGWFGVDGYVMEWARLTAWGVNAAPKQKGVRVGECLKSGGRAFVVALAWGLAIIVGFIVFHAVPWVGNILVLVWGIICIYLALLTLVAQLRATIYQSFGAGLRVGAVWELGARDPFGLFRVVGIAILFGLVELAISAAVLCLALVNAVPDILDIMAANSYPYYADDYTPLVQLVLVLVEHLGPVLIVLGLICGLIGVVSKMMCTTAVGLWMRQYNVPRWGRDEDPLPEPTTPSQAAASDAAGATTAPTMFAEPAAPDEPTTGETAAPDEPTSEEPADPLDVAEPEHAPILMPPAASEVVAAAEAEAAAALGDKTDDEPTDEVDAAEPEPANAEPEPGTAELEPAEPTDASADAADPEPGTAELEPNSDFSENQGE